MTDAVPRKILARYLVREGMGVAVAAGALIGAAGDLGWPQGWAVVALTALWAAATAIVLLKVHPGLIAERLAPKRGSARRDVVVVSLYGVVQLAVLVVAGLDHRLGWTPSLPSVAVVAALTLVAIGHALAVWATAHNAYFSQVVRIQSERGHRVVDTGPYRLVRHPAYTGSVLVSLAVPVALSSWPAIAMGLLGAGLMVVRTALEDATLRRELEGYADYAARTRARLVPGLW